MFYISLLVFSLIYYTGFRKFWFRLDSKKFHWNVFTRVVSTFNALQCVAMTSHVLLNSNWFKLFNLHFEPSIIYTNSLYTFCSYLFVDGLFQLPDLIYDFNFSSFLSIAHHVVGGYGIYLIAEAEMGFFLGWYFAMTEISTPFLNLSWFFRKKVLLKIFYYIFFVSRIVTIPILLAYLWKNSEAINMLIPIHVFMSYYGSYTLVALNSVWFYFLTRKVFC